MLELLKLELGIVDKGKDMLLNRYISKCIKRIEDFTRQENAYVVEHLQDQVIDLAIIMYNRRGTEGATSTSVSGMSESYVNDMPQDIKKSLYAHRKMVR